ncbi:extracellular solute-binding protein, partial [Sinorhizobium sp. 6-117]|uniref:ABC transporter substrate-binding protein n=1 Tax=Sinorhizobium sp. 6-117 TaxID=3049090 RepID=UPI0024C2D202
MKDLKALVSSIAIACALASSASSIAAAAQCTDTIRVIAQPRDGLTLLENYKDEFAKLSGGADFQIDYLNENDRRAKTKADASTIGKYNVYYIDEANVALFAKSGWVAPLTDYYPADYDYADFDPGRQKVATYDGKVWFAPLTGGGDLMVYRKDLLEAAGIKPPTTLDEYIAAVRALHQPDKGIYGTALRGQRGSGANVWRWMPYFKGFGGNWFEGDKPVFDGDAAVKATETYLEIFKYSAPGSQTGGWDEAVGAFTSGQVALLIESTPLVGMALDPKSSQVADKIGYLPPPTPLTGGAVDALVGLMQRPHG